MSAQMQADAGAAEPVSFLLTLLDYPVQKYKYRRSSLLNLLAYLAQKYKY